MTSMAASTLLRLDNVSAGYDSFQALFGVSLEVRAGESVAVIGPNGAGKTTLLRAISKLINCSGGDLMMDGRRYNDIPARDISVKRSDRAYRTRIVATDVILTSEKVA